MPTGLVHLFMSLSRERVGDQGVSLIFANWSKVLHNTTIIQVLEKGQVR
jgi:hypothetical protein